MGAHRLEGDDIHAVAERFMRDYLTETGSQHQPVQLSVKPQAGEKGRIRVSSSNSHDGLPGTGKFSPSSKEQRTYRR